MNLNLNKSKGWFCLMAIVAICFTACQPESVNDTLGPLPTPTFTATPLAANPNKVVVTSTTQGVFMWQWDFGNGTKSNKETDTAVFLKKGDYQIKLTAFSQGGSASATQQISIADDMAGTNLLKGGDMSDPTAWTILDVGGSQTTITFSNGTLNFSNTGNTNGAIYQAVQVEAGKQYKFSADVQGSGATNSWFEIYFGASQPTTGSDYTDNKFVSLNTWSGCGGSAFSGDIADIGCDGSGTGTGGIITFAQSGTVYLVIKSGSSGGTLGTGGITIDNVSLIEL